VKAIFEEARERARNGKKLLAEHLAALEEVKSLLERWDDREIQVGHNLSHFAQMRLNE